ncbi:TetR family transcriptional regulator [Amycolatopsis echigonensis]|uniref:TetR family transcriptional regulator n=1 Tax=Amycolatopsis echigonensis TaxID=2576905 RepID=A0A2N3WCD0_9PSEU|nr:TetR family transcriptional regulator [Amycolatopsis niigatensis]
MADGRRNDRHPRRAGAAEGNASGNNGQVSEEVQARTRNRWGEGERLRGEILAAASRLLSELDGEDALTIRGVARAVGIAPASIYQHFSDRAALVTGLAEHEFGRLRLAMEAAESRVPAEDSVGRVRALLHAYCRFAMDNPGHYRLMTANGASRIAPGVRPHGPTIDLIDRISAAFARCAESGVALRVPADRAGVIAFVGAHGRVALFHSSGRRPGEDAVVSFADELLSLIFA